jgi:hypothetical protein
MTRVLFLMALFGITVSTTFPGNSQASHFLSSTTFSNEQANTVLTMQSLPQGGLPRSESDFNHGSSGFDQIPIVMTKKVKFKSLDPTTKSVRVSPDSIMSFSLRFVLSGNEDQNTFYVNAFTQELPILHSYPELNQFNCTGKLKLDIGRTFSFDCDYVADPKIKLRIQGTATRLVTQTLLCEGSYNGQSSYRFGTEINECLAKNEVSIPSGIKVENLIVSIVKTNGESLGRSQSLSTIIAQKFEVGHYPNDRQNCGVISLQTGEHPEVLKYGGIMSWVQYKFDQCKEIAK